MKSLASIQVVSRPWQHCQSTDLCQQAGKTDEQTINQTHLMQFESKSNSRIDSDAHDSRRLVLAHLINATALPCNGHANLGECMHHELTHAVCMLKQGS